MKNYKKGLLGVMVLTAMSLMAAEERTIVVNTFADENGENSNNCSLREALVAAKKNAAYGGCSQGNTNITQQDIIQLDAGTYVLKHGELQPDSFVQIRGKSRDNYDKKHVLSGYYPAYEDIKTTIDAGSQSRLFNTSATFAALTLTDLALKNGQADYGGAILAGGDLTLNRAAILNSAATEAGGAIFNATQSGEKSLTIAGSLLQANQSKKGSVLAMDCIANFSSSKPNISITQSSMIKNGNSSSVSVLDFCGTASAKISTSTLAQNIASSANGALIKMVSEGNQLVGASSSLLLMNNTIVENDVYTALNYDNNGAKYLAYNVLAYNGRNIANAKSCRYKNNETPPDSIIIDAYVNALELGTEKCDLPKAALDQAVDIKKNLDVSSIAMSNILSNLMPSSEYNVFLPLYYPKPYAKGNDLINFSELGCGKSDGSEFILDQRGLERVVDGTLILNPDQRNLCEIGSVEMMNLTAADVDELKNISLINLVDGYQAKLDQLKKDVVNPDLSKFKIANQADVDQLELYLTSLKKNLKYRGIYFDPFKLALEAEKAADSAGNRTLKILNTDNYNVSVKTLGLGTDITVNSGVPTVVNLDPDSDLVCQWNADLKEIIIYRTGANTTVSGVQGYCAYTLTEKADPANPSAVLASSSGILKTEIQNLPPVAVADIYEINSSNNLSVRVNPLENDHDRGDGPDELVPAGKHIWHQNAEGKNIPIKFGTMPAGITWKAELSGPCPNAFARETCYGGTIEFTVKNNLSQFDYKIPYIVFDSDEQQSNETIITLKNTAKNTNTSSSGGGSIGVFGLIGLFGLAMMRRMRKS
ncbi:CSLREA domain-containing protein [Acinetobacter tianfuensis]|uniref:CSLREA domain-containing protein n=1 Tax=Acinetobacter tianfuensis TaxID=2419603 RepID=A0A3A8EEW8_9GAMM|nr:CSLREA domain-containing protein [Acinetobacter tianfuensis]RKG32638.1 CSLREA domain-containing protein [Acinetobacter tianfuensis]